MQRNLKAKSEDLGYVVGNQTIAKIFEIDANCLHNAVGYLEAKVENKCKEI